MDENREEEKFVEDRHYKIRCNKEYYIRRKDVPYGDMTISNYFILCTKTNNNSKKSFPKKVRFKSGVSLKDGTKILIKDMFEDVFENKKDMNNPIWQLFILDFDITEEPDDMNSAIIDYQSNMENIRIDREREENNNDWLF